MKRILTAALALTLLNGTAVLAAPSGQNHGNQSDTQDKRDRKDKQDRKDQKGNHKANRHSTPASQAAPAPHGKPGAQVRKAKPARRPARNEKDVRERAAPSVPIFRDQSHNPIFRNRSNVRTSTPRWSRGDRLPNQYRQKQYYVSDWQQHGLRRPPRGYHWVRDDNNDFFLAAIATGVIMTIVSRDNRDRNWNRHYSRTYTYNDDLYYRECRNKPDPAGILGGAIIGGFLGNAAGHGNRGATMAGVIFGGAAGAALTSNMDCEDRSYAYRTYYDGFNSGRSGRYYDWNNPRNGHRGRFHVRSYYNDPYGFRCARFTQTTYVRGRSHNAKGVACRQPNGSWAVVN